MEVNSLDTKNVQVAVQVIIHAGNARTLVNKATTAFAERNFDKADEYLKKAETEITKAHKIQTNMIQAEARGQKLELSLLITHAQDTLMSANTEIRLTKNFLKLIKPLYEQLIL